MNSPVNGCRKLTCSKITYYRADRHFPSSLLPSPALCSVTTVIRRTWRCFSLVCDRVEVIEEVSALSSLPSPQRTLVWCQFCSESESGRNCMSFKAKAVGLQPARKASHALVVITADSEDRMLKRLPVAERTPAKSREPESSGSVVQKHIPEIFLCGLRVSCRRSKAESDLHASLSTLYSATSATSATSADLRDHLWRSKTLPMVLESTVISNRSEAAITASSSFMLGRSLNKERIYCREHQ